MKLIRVDIAWINVAWLYGFYDICTQQNTIYPVLNKMKVLVCPLNWGLGHAARCVPIIRRLIADGHELVIAADGYPLSFLRDEFPNLKFIEYPSYKVMYSSSNSQVGAMLKTAPNIICGIVKEHHWLKKLLRTEHFDQVISDNRFGLWNKNTYSIYITHQLMVKMPAGLKILESIIWLVHRVIINRYNRCWIPDEAGLKNLSGDLSHKYPLPQNAEFIGILSRFDNLKEVKPNPEYQTVAVLSGIEPQRTILEAELIKRYADLKAKTLIIQGHPEIEKKIIRKGSVTIISHLPSRELVSVLLGAEKIIARSGYSTIMDLYTLNCLDKAELIPTPGQTEQEYLAEKNK